MEWTFARARPRWTQRAREDVRRERRDLGFPEEGPVKVVDVPLALRILGSQQQWRHFTFELSLTVILLVLLLCYSLGARYISLSYYVGRSVEQDLDRVFNSPTTTFDLNTPLNTSRPFKVYSDGTLMQRITNLDPDTLLPIDFNPDLFYERCLPGGFPSNSTSPDTTGWCLKFTEPKKFKGIRNIEQFALWVSHAMFYSSLFNQVRIDTGKAPILLGAIRIRQLRSLLPNDIVDNQNREQTSDIKCSPPPTFQNLSAEANVSFENALTYQSASSLNTFRNPINLDALLMGRSSPNLAQRLDFYYPASGYAFDLPRCNPVASRAIWTALLDNCNWVSSNFSSAFFVSLAAYEPVSDAQIFAQYSFEIYPQGTRLASKDVRVFRIPGGSSDRAVVWRILLCTASLAELVFFIARAIYRGSKTGHTQTAVNRWLILDVISLIILQAAVWISISNSLDAKVQAISSPEGLATLANCSYSDHVTLFDAVSYDEKVEDLLLGISLILQGLKFFQLCQFSPRLSAAYSIINAVGYEILWWFILTACIFFFFAFGASFMFGLVLPQFYTLPAAFASTFLIFSKVPKYSSSGAETTTMFEDEFWRNFESPNLASLMWELAEYMRPYEIDPLFGFAFWLGLLVVLVYWIMRNLLLGVVLSGYESVRREIEADELDVEERSFLKRIRTEARRRKGAEVSRLKAFADRMRQLMWRIWNNWKIDQLLVFLRTDPSISRRGFATTQEVEKLFKDIGIVRDGKSLSILDASQDPGEWFKQEFFASFEFSLIAVDEAILTLSQQEHPFALSLESVAAIRQEKTLDKAIEALLDKCEDEFSSYSNLPFVQELRASKSGTRQQRERMVEVAKRAAAKCPEVSGDEDSFFDVQALAMRLATRLSEEVEMAVARCLDRSGAGESDRMDVAVGLVYNSCVEDLGLYLDAVPDRQRVRDLIASGLKRAKYASNRDDSRAAFRVTESVAFALAEIFPCSMMGWQAEPSPRELLRCRELFEVRMAGIATEGRVGPEESEESSGEDDSDGNDGYSMSSEIGDNAGGSGNAWSRQSSFRLVDTGGVSAVPSNVDMEDTFDPTAQQKWEKALYSGEFFLSLTVVHALRSATLADQLTRELIQLERNQVKLEKELLSARRLLDEKIAERKPLAASVGDVQNHGIEPHPNDKTFHVHYINPVTKEYKFVGVFYSQEEAEIALTKTIVQEAALTSTAEDDDLDTRDRRDADSWEDDDRHYGLLAKETKQQKKLERKRRHQGAGVLADALDSPGVPSPPTKKHTRRPGDGDDDDDDDDSEDDDDDQQQDEESERDAVDDAEAVVQGEGKKSTAAKRLADWTTAVYTRVADAVYAGWFAFQTWLNSSNENRIKFDTLNNVWLDSHDNVVKVITKPKTVPPLAGKRWAKLREDQE